MSLFSVGHQFTINQVPYTKNVDTLLNIQKRRTQIVYRTNSNVDNVNLSYVRSLPLLSDTSVIVNDKSIGLLENREVESQDFQVYIDTTVFTSNTDRLLITDIFTETISTQAPTPLFFKHQLQTELSSNEVYKDIEILNSKFIRANISKSLIDTTDGIVYNNLENKYSSITGTYVLYYISYRVLNTTTGVSVLHREILNNVNIFRPALFSDLDGFNNIITGRKVYLVEDTLDGLFEIRLPVSDTYASRSEPTARLSVLSPPSSDANDPWFTSITNGKFISSVQTSDDDTSVFKYYIPEFGNQTFNPIAPYKLIIDEIGIRIEKRVIKTVHDKVIIDEDEALYPSVYVYRKDGSFKFAITQNETLQGTSTVVSGKVFADVGFESLDMKSGFLILPTGYELTDTDVIYITYYYEEDKYEYNLFNLNPLSNTDLLKQTLVIFLRPEPFGETHSQSLFYLLVNEDGLVVDSNYDAEDIEGNLQDGSNVQDLISSGLLWYGRTDFPDWAEDNSLDFITEYSVQGEPNLESFLILGDIFVRESSTPGSLALTDTRVRGGGLKQSLIDESKELNSEINWYWDISMWDGRPYPGAAAYFVEIPVEVLEEQSGRFSPTTARDTVLRHTAAGIYPVIWKHNEYEPQIIDINYTGSGIYIEYTQLPDDSVVDIYMSDNETGPWVLTSSGISNNISGNSVLVSILESEIEKYVVVVGYPSGGELSFGGSIDE